MTNASRARKISQFLAKTTLPSDAQLTLISGGTNFRIGLVDFLAALGVTGTIVSDGDSGGTPVLDVAGSVNNIRIIEDGPGVKASVSALNGLTLEHDFQRLGEGLPVVGDLTVQSPTLKSLIAGTDITFSETDNKITISRTGAAPPVSIKTVLVQQLSDLPTASGGFRTLAADTEYFFQNPINVGTDRFVLSNNTVINSPDSAIITITYTGTNPMFTGVSVTSKITKVRLDCLNADLFDFTGSTDYIFQFINCSVTQCDGIGEFGDFLALKIFDVSFENNITTGARLLGSNGVFLSGGGNLVVQSAGIAFDAGTATFDAFSLDTGFASLASGATYLNLAAASANMNAGRTGTIALNKNVLGTGTMLSGGSPDDAQWEYDLNDDIPNTRPDGLLSMQANAVNTVIAAAGTPVLVAGTWVVELSSQMTGTTGGRLTYNGIKNAVLPITSSITIAPVSGGTVAMSIEVAVNGTAVPGSKRSASASSGGGSAITVPWQHIFNTGDFVEIFVTNEDTTVDLLVSSAVHRVN